MLNAVMRAYLLRMGKQLDRKTKDPLSLQAAALQKLKKKILTPQVPRDLPWADVQSLEDLRHLPQTTYDDYAPLVHTLPNLQMLARTSGTSGVTKVYPVTKEYAQAYRRFMMRMYAWHTLHFANGMQDSWLAGSMLTVAARPFLGNSKDGIPEGFISGMMTANPPLAIRHRLLPSRPVLDLPDWESKLEPMYQEAKERDVRLLIGLPAIALYLLTHVHSRIGLQPLDTLWPNMNWVLSTGTALTPVLRKQFNSLFSDKHNLRFFEAYFATEGQFAYSMPGGESLVLDPFETVYQFEETAGEPLKQLHEVEVGKTYTITVTTPGGLVNYRMGDRVRIVSTAPVSIQILGREYEEISAAGEKMCTQQIEKAMTEAFAYAELPPDDYSVWLDEGRPNSLGLAVEADAPARARRLAEHFDNALQVVNPIYAEHRRGDGIYGPVRARPLAPGTYHAQLRCQVDRGQFKRRRLFKSQADFEAFHGLT